jgi:hypothetical protein
MVKHLQNIQSVMRNIATGLAEALIQRERKNKDAQDESQNNQDR